MLLAGVRRRPRWFGQANEHRNSHCGPTPPDDSAALSGLSDTQHPSRLKLPILHSIL